MLDILLLNVHRRYLNYKPQYGGFLGIYLLSAFLRQEGYESKGFSGSLQEGKRHIDALCSSGNVSMVGLYCDYENITENILLCRHIKESYGLPVAVGGPQATALTADFFLQSGCDVAVNYEGELTLLELMNYFLEGIGNLSQIAGISYLNASGLVKNPDRDLIHNLDALPFIDEKCYLEEDTFFHGLSIMTGRGCPFQCSFCHEGTHTRQVRFRSVENVLAEIDAYLDKWRGGNLYILFTDDTLTLNPERLCHLCEGISERRKRIPFRWFCEGHVHTLYQHPEMIKYLAQGGCTRIQLGIEAGTANVLQAYGKNTTPDEIITVVRNCRDAGIMQIYGNIILAGANFSYEIYESDKAFVNQLITEGQGTVEIGVLTYWPLAQTKMTNTPKNYGIIIKDADFFTAAGDFPQVETVEINRWAVSEMQRKLEEHISQLMLDMLENWQVPTERIMTWFASLYTQVNPSGCGMWFLKLSQEVVLFSYYEMLYLGEGVDSKHVKCIEQAHPLRVAPLYRYMKYLPDEKIELRGEVFNKEEREVVILTTGKLSVQDIAVNVKENISFVTNVLNRLEQKHYIVYTM